MSCHLFFWWPFFSTPIGMNKKKKIPYSQMISASGVSYTNHRNKNKIATRISSLVFSFHETSPRIPFWGCTRFNRRRRLSGPENVGFVPHVDFCCSSRGVGSDKRKPRGKLTTVRRLTFKKLDFGGYAKYVLLRFFCGKNRL